MTWWLERSVTLRGRTVQILAAGPPARRPPVIIVGGLGSPAQDWDGVVDRLGGRTRVVWFDGIRPGGRTDELGRPVHSTAELIRDTGTAARLPPPWLLVGHSLGGLYVQGFARLYPELTAGVLLVDSTIAAEASSSGHAHRGVRAMGCRIVRWLAIDAGGAATLGRLARRLAVWSTTLHGRDLLPADNADHTYRDRRAAAVIVDEWIVSSDAAVELGHIAASHAFPDRPATVLVGARHGRPSRRRDAAWVRAQCRLADLTNARFVVLDDTAHLVMLDRPDAVVEAIIEMIDPS